MTGKQPVPAGDPDVRHQQRAGEGAEGGWAQRRLRSHIAALTSASRVTGIDVARALAIIGMIGAHVGFAPELVWSDPSTWGGVVHGRSAILFAVLAGVSIALVSGGARGVAGSGLDIRQVRLGLVGRGILIFAVGIGLEALGTSVAVILAVYGMLFVLSAAFVGWRRRWLLISASALALLGPALMVVLRAVSAGGGGETMAIFAYSIYPPLVWLVFVMAGLVVGRSDVRRMRTAVVMLVAGLVLAVAGYGAGELISPEEDVDEEAYAEDDSFAADGSFLGGTSVDVDDVDLTGHECEIDEDQWVTCYPAEDALAEEWEEIYSEDDALEEEYLDEGEHLDDESLDSGFADSDIDESYGSYLREGLEWDVFRYEALGVYEHSGGTPEIIGSGGFALAVTGLCLITFRRALLRRLIFPVAAMGSMPLTAYAAHIVVIRVLAEPWDCVESNMAWFFLAAGLMLACALWALLWGRGPLERLTGWAAHALSAAPRTRNGASAELPLGR